MKNFIKCLLFFFLLTTTQFVACQDFFTDLKRATEYYKQGQYAEAAKLFEKWSQIAGELYGKNDSSIYLQLVSSAGRCFYIAGMYIKAEPFVKEVSLIRKKQMGENSLDYGISINNLAQLYMEMGQYEQSEPLMKESIRIAKESLGENHPDYGIRLNNLAQLYHKMGWYDQAESFIKEAMRIDQENFGENHSSYSRDLNNLSQLYQDMGKYDQAESLIKESMRITKETLGENHFDYGIRLNNLASLYIKMGQYTKVEPLIKESIRIDKEAIKENHPEYCRRLNNLAQLYKEMGQYEQSEPLMKESIRIAKESLGENHPDYGIYLNNLAILCRDMGRYDQSASLMNEAIQITKEFLGENHPKYGMGLNNLAQLYNAMGRYGQSEPLIKEAIRIARESLGENHPDYSTCLNNLASLYEVMGKYGQAESLMKEVVQIDKESLGESHPDYGTSLCNLASLYEVMGKYGQAESLMKEGIRIIKLGENHPDYLVALTNLGLLYQNSGKNEQAGHLMKEAYTVLINLIKNNTGFLSEKETEEFFNTLIYNLEIYQSFNSGDIKDHPSTGDFAFDIELFRKGVLLRSTQGVRGRILASGDTSLINGFNQLLSLRKQIEILCSLDSTKRFDDPVKVDQKANDIEKFLTLKSQDYSKAKEELDYTWKDVLKQIKPYEAVIEFSSFKYYDKRWTDSTYYYALVLRKDNEHPKLVFLFEEKQINALLPSASASEEGILKTYSISHEESKAKDLYKLVWAPLEPYLEGVTKIDFAVSLQLNRIAFHALSDTSGNLLLNKYDLVQLSSTREVALPKDDKRLESIAIFGGIDYSIDTTDMLAMAREVNTDNLSRSLYRSDTTSRNLSLTYLPGTMEEASEVGKECKEKGIDVKLYSGKLATEEQFRLLGEKKSPSVIHIATHGFYFPEEKQKDRDERMRFMQIGEQENQFVYSPDPLIRSGLAMAGANHAWKGEKIPEGVEDGILTARDVSQLNLLNTELVVLSACQTGLGDVKGSEGVYGLQRGFKMAGARYLMMSLWKVPDEATKEFMTNFYSHLSSGMAIRESYRNTQKDISAKYPEDPFRWAAFVVVE